ncbi:RND family efflux transporter MFP subunit [Heliophilum fasciatum]|uniref:RND family efflux transporter MFP subunit n=2 Tax=Heliophilum fasciatum TaxID=35700 RepID=A0A4R2RMK8_9FIRM|nr:RND family efflux transporter MFP subunit [Heliophilum fasciatum]
MTMAASRQQLHSEFSGTLQGIEEATLAFEVGGRISATYVKEGDQLAAGDVLAQIDPTDYSYDLAAASATAAQTGASLRQVENGATSYEINQAQALREKARANLEKSKADFERYQALFESGSLSRKDYESAQTQLTIAENDFTVAEQAYQNIISGARDEVKEQTRALYEQSLTRQQKAAYTLDKTRLKAPFSGTVTAKVTQAGQMVGAGTTVYKIASMRTLKVVIPVPDRDIARWRKDDKVTLELYGQRREGLVKYIYPAASQNTGTVGVEIWVDNPNQDWLPGQVVHVYHLLQEKEALWVPVGAVVRRGAEQPYLFVLQDGHAVKRPVELGALINDHLEILQGIQAGDPIITSSADRLFDGDPVAPLAPDGNASGTTPPLPATGG